MNASLKLQERSFPARLADLDFTARLPADWISHELPREDVDFSNPTAFAPLAIITAPHAAIVFAFAARPAYDDGTLNDWTTYHLNHNQLQPRAMGRDRVSGVAAVSGEAVQSSELGPMLVRFAFLEDGGRLLNLTLTAPEQLADSVRDAWFAMLQSFKLGTPRGSRFPVEDHPDLVPAAPIPEPWLESKPQAAPEARKPAQPRATWRTSSRLPTFADFALAPDAGTLDPEHPTNANLRNRGAGLVPNVFVQRDDQRCAIVGAGAIVAQITVPYGWHVIDDGKRTLVLDPGGKVQVNLSLLPRERRSNKAILDEIEAQMRKDYPHPEFERMHEPPIHALVARHIADGDQPLVQFHMLHPFRDDSMVLRARVTATPDQASAAANLADRILDSCAFDAFQLRDEPPAPATSSTNRGGDGEGTASRQGAARNPAEGPAWWHEALALEAQGRLDAAEKHIQESCPNLHYAEVTADLYRRRMIRLKEAGDEAGALEAFRKSSRFIDLLASLATSGGEGAALAARRDEFRGELVAAYGSDPEARP